jgi:hypothetical protein
MASVIRGIDNFDTAGKGMLVLGTAVTASGTSFGFAGTVPSWAQRVTVTFNGISTDGTSFYALRVRANGNVVSSGYVGAAGSIYETENITVNVTTTEIALQAAAPVAGTAMSGVVTLTKMNATGPVWAYSGTTYASGGAVPVMSYTAGVVALSNALDGVSLTTAGGLNNFDAGTMNILYE